MLQHSLSAPASPQSKEDAIRESVMQAAQRLFQEHGLDKVTLEDVAKAIGKGKSTLYYYYKSKEEIFTAVMGREIDNVITQVAEAVAHANTAEEKLFSFCATKLCALRKKLALYNIVCSEANKQAEFGCMMRQRYFKRESVLLKGIITFGIARGELRAMSEQDLNTLVFVVLSGLHGLEMEMLVNDNFDMLDSSIKLLTRTLIHGIKA